MRGVVYTARFGHYDPLREVKLPRSADFDYVVLTDDASLTSETWQVVHTPRQFLDPARDAKRVKHLVHEFFPDHEVSVYHDARVDLLQPPEALVATFLPEEGDGFGCVRHPERDCLYEEGRKVVEWGIDLEAVVAPQLERYRALGYPEHYGLIAGTVLVRRHQRPDVRAAMEAWFLEMVRGSRREQVSFNFVAWQRGFAFRAQPIDPYCNPFFRWLPPTENRIPYGFDDRAYLAANPDVAANGLDPREHWSRYGYREGRLLRR